MTGLEAFVYWITLTIIMVIFLYLAIDFFGPGPPGGRLAE